MMLLLSALLVLALSSESTAQRAGLSPRLGPLGAGGGPPQQAEILEQLSEASPDGSYHTKWSSANGISFEESGQPKQLPDNQQAEEVQGSAGWTSPEGQQIQLSWRADENGAQFQGEHLPTPPPLPELIRRALDYIAANPPRSAEDGAYVEAEQLKPPGRRF